MKALVAQTSFRKDTWDRVRARIMSRNGESSGVTLELKEIPDPPLINDDWVRIRSIVSGVSDIEESLLLGEDTAGFGPYLVFPFVPGHENFGIVTETGKDVHDVELGQRVVIDPVLSCTPRGIAPVCPSCAQGEPYRCRNFAQGHLGPGTMIGACPETGGGWGDSFVIHRSGILALPDDVSSELGMFVPELSRCLKAVLSHPPAPTDRVLVVGSGSLGLLLLYVLAIRQFRNEVVVAAEHPFEADAARSLGYERVLVRSDRDHSFYDELAESLGAAVRISRTGAVTFEGGADLVYETTGRRGSVEEALRFTGEGRKTVLVGRRHVTNIDLSPVWLRGVTAVSPGWSGLETMDGRRGNVRESALDLLATHGFPIEDFVTHRFSLEDHKKALATLEKRGGNKALKVIFQHVV